MALRFKCDICGREVPFKAGYGMTTDQVVSRTNYWEYVLRNKWALPAKATRFLNPRTRNTILTTFVSTQAQSTTPWLICDKCIAIFEDIDQVESRRFAEKLWSSPNAQNTGWTQITGAGSYDKALDAFVEAWVRVFKKLPVPMTIITQTPEAAKALYDKLTKSGQTLERDDTVQRKMSCPKCGTIASVDTVRCRNCGYKFV
jgi:hypothetical protein